jgi:hypothetical protein
MDKYNLTKIEQNFSKKLGINVNLFYKRLEFIVYEKIINWLKLLIQI